MIDNQMLMILVVILEAIGILTVEKKLVIPLYALIIGTIIMFFMT